ncbi:MAG: hypothetical protein R3181_15345, partial [Rubricoccaceae bacterium]|nr:hypothetical protein [Rubricoccaceae bacterium]
MPRLDGLPTMGALTQPGTSERLLATLPLVALLLLIGLNAATQRVLFACGAPALVDCQALDPTAVYPMAEPLPADDPRQASRQAGRIIWGFLTALNALAAFVALTAAAGAIWTARRPHRTTVLAGAALAALAVTALSLTAPTTYLFLVEPVLRGVIGSQTAQFGMPGVFGVMNATNVATFVGALLLAVAICYTIMPPRADPPAPSAAATEGDPDAPPDPSAERRSDPIRTLASIEDQAARVRTLLYIGTLLLIVGVTRLNAVLAWATTFLPVDAADRAQPFNLAVVSVAGAYYTLTLAAAYLPAVVVLKRRAKAALARGNTDPQEVRARLEGMQLSFTVKESFPRILAILGPLLAGPVGDLIGLLA